MRHLHYDDISRSNMQIHVRDTKNNDIGGSLRSRILAENVEMLRINGIVPPKLPNGFAPVDIDVTPFDNSNLS